MARVYMWHDAFTHVTWLIHTCDMTHSRNDLLALSMATHDALGDTNDMTHSYLWHDSCIYVTWRIHTHVKWLIHICDMTHSRNGLLALSMATCAPFDITGWRRLIAYLKLQVIFHKRATNYRALWRKMTWLSHICYMTRLHMWHDSSVHVTWLIATWLMHIRDMIHSSVWHDSLVSERQRLLLLAIHVTWLIYVCDVTHMHMAWLARLSATPLAVWYTWHDSFIHARDLTHLMYEYVFYSSRLTSVWTATRQIRDMIHSHMNHEPHIFVHIYRPKKLSTLPQYPPPHTHIQRALSPSLSVARARARSLSLSLSRFLFLARDLSISPSLSLLRWLTMRPKSQRERHPCMNVNIHNLTLCYVNITPR